MTNYASPFLICHKQCKEVHSQLMTLTQLAINRTKPQTHNRKTSTGALASQQVPVLNSKEDNAITCLTIINHQTRAQRNW